MERSGWYAGRWAWMNFGFWAVEEKATGSFVGEVGCAIHKRDIEPPLDDKPELDWVLATGFHGKGYATESVRAAMNWGTLRFSGRETVCIISPENVKSIMVAKNADIESYRGPRMKARQPYCLRIKSRYRTTS